MNQPKQFVISKQLTMLIVGGLLTCSLILSGCAGAPPAAEAPTGDVPAAPAGDTAAVAPESASTAAEQPEPTVPPTEEVAAAAPPILVPTEEPVEAPVAATPDWTITASVDGDYYILGNPQAPIRLIDFSDFM